MKTIILLFLLLFLAGCQNIESKEYYSNGTLKKEYKQSGFLPWSNNKNISFEAHAI